MRERLLPDIVPINASAIERWIRCPREYRNRDLLGLPESNPGPPSDVGNLVHALLARPARAGSCRDPAFVDDVLGGPRLRRSRADRGVRRTPRAALPLPRRALVARGRARAVPPRARADVHGDGPARRGVGARRHPRHPRLQDRLASRPSASPTTRARGSRRGSPRRSPPARPAPPRPVRAPRGRGRRRPRSVRARRRGPRRDRGGAARDGRGADPRRPSDDFPGVADAEVCGVLPVPVDLPRQRGAGRADAGRCPTRTSTTTRRPAPS